MAFFGLLKPHAGAVVLSLTTLTVATLLGLIPPVGTNLIPVCP